MNQRRENLVSLRKNKSWSQKDVVDLLETKFNVVISESYYGMIEQGVRTPKLNIALTIAELFRTKPNDIFFEVNPNKMLGDQTAKGGYVIENP